MSKNCQNWEILISPIALQLYLACFKKLPKVVTCLQENWKFLGSLIVAKIGLVTYITGATKNNSRENLTTILKSLQYWSLQHNNLVGYSSH